MALSEQRAFPRRYLSTAVGTAVISSTVLSDYQEISTSVRYHLQHHTQVHPPPQLGARHSQTPRQCHELAQGLLGSVCPTPSSYLALRFPWEVMSHTDSPCSATLQPGEWLPPVCITCVYGCATSSFPSLLQDLPDKLVGPICAFWNFSLRCLALVQVTRFISFYFHCKNKHNSINVKVKSKDL